MHQYGHRPPTMVARPSAMKLYHTAMPSTMHQEPRPWSKSLHHTPRAFTMNQYPLPCSKSINHAARPSTIRQEPLKFHREARPSTMQQNSTPGSKTIYHEALTAPLKMDQTHSWQNKYQNKCQGNRSKTSQHHTCFKDQQRYQPRSNTLALKHAPRRSNMFHEAWSKSLCQYVRASTTQQETPPWSKALCHAARPSIIPVGPVLPRRPCTTRRSKAVYKQQDSPPKVALQ